jgi:hypothetical protein
MSRKITIKNRQFCVTDDPEQVIGTALDLITSDRNRPQINERLAPDGDGFTLDTLGTVTRAYTRDELPEPWNEDPGLDPERSELWALYRDPDRDDPYVRHAVVLTGEELRALVSEALRVRGER